MWINLFPAFWVTFASPRGINRSRTEPDRIGPTWTEDRIREGSWIEDRTGPVKPWTGPGRWLAVKWHGLPMSRGTPVPLCILFLVLQPFCCQGDSSLARSARATRQDRATTCSTEKKIRHLHIPSTSPVHRSTGLDRDRSENRIWELLGPRTGPMRTGPVRPGPWSGPVLDRITFTPSFTTLQCRTMALLIVGAKSLLSSYYWALILGDCSGDPDCLPRDHFHKSCFHCAAVLWKRELNIMLMVLTFRRSSDPCF